MMRATYVESLTHRVARCYVPKEAADSWLPGPSALGGAMKYEKPEVRDFGSIVDHTYSVDSFPGGSGEVIVDNF